MKLITNKHFSLKTVRISGTDKQSRPYCQYCNLWVHLLGC